MELSDGVYLPFCLFSEGGGVKIVPDLISGGLRWSKIAFLPFVRQGGGGGKYLISIWKSQMDLIVFLPFGFCPEG